MDITMPRCAWLEALVLVVTSLMKDLADFLEGIAMHATVNDKVNDNSQRQRWADIVHKGRTWCAAACLRCNLHCLAGNVAGGFSMVWW